jgi:transketolase
MHTHVDKLDRTKNIAKFIRKSVVKMTSLGSSSHVGSCLSIVDIVAVLYGCILNIFPNNPKSNSRDFFILSKGHAGAAIYSALSYVGFFDKSLLKSHCQDGSNLSGHVSHKGIPGVEFSTGSLGHGLPVAAGVALSFKIDNKDNKAYVLMSDGEFDEGSNWEAILFAAHHKLDNLVVIVDRNELQSIKSTEDTLSLEPFMDKLHSFGWNAIEVDGHNHVELIGACQNRKKSKPTVVIAKTTKGKGVSFMENNILWHYRSPQGKELKDALADLEKGDA